MADREKNQQPSKESDDRFRRVLEDLEVGVTVVGPRTEALLFNNAALELLGLTGEQLLGRTAFDPAWNVIHEDWSPFTGGEHPSARAISTKRPVRNVVAGIFRPSKRDRKWLLCSAVPHLAPDGSVTEVICSFSDITEQKKAEEAIRDAHDALKKQARLLDLAHDAIIVRDFDGTIAYWNEGAVKKYLWSREEALGKPCHQLLRAEYPGSFEDVQHQLLAEGFWQGEVRHARRDGKRLTVASRQVLDRQDAGLPPVVLEINRDITKLKEVEQQLRDSQKSLRELSGYLLQSQDEERWRIARDLHDSTSPNLTGLLTRLNILIRSAKDLKEEAQKALEESLKLASDAANFIRTLASGLHPPVLDEQGLAAAIRWYAEGIAAQTSLQVEIESPADLARLPRDAERSLYRLAQECITRIRLRLGSTRVKVRLEATTEEFVLEIREEGDKKPTARWVSAEAEATGPDVALIGMHERMERLGGRLEIISGGSGTLVRAILPLGRSTASQRARAKLPSSW